MLLQHRPPDRRPVFRQTELALTAAKKDLSYAHHRLEQAHKRLDELGPLSQLRRHWRKERAATLERIDAFTDDIYKGEEKISHYQRVLKGLRPELDRRLKWDEEHDWPDARLRTVDAELTEIERPAHQDPSRAASLLTRAPGVDRPAWLDRLAEVAPPPLPGHDAGPGIDLGL